MKIKVSLGVNQMRSFDYVGELNQRSTFFEASFSLQKFTLELS